MAHLRIAACQINTVVGDLNGNVAKIVAALNTAEAADCDLAVFPELAITGYPPEDLVVKPGFVADNLAALEKVAASTGRCAAVVGFVETGRDLFNAAAVCANGRVVGTYRKQILPNYSVFDESRTFVAGPGDDGHEPCLFEIAGIKVGVTICEDSWSPDGPILDQAASGAELVLNLNASPYHRGKLERRIAMLSTRAADASATLVYVNQVGGQDELVFDGASLIFAADGSIVARAPQFREDVLICDLTIDPIFRKRLLDPRGRASSPALRVVPVSDRPIPHAEHDRAVARIAPLLDPHAEVYEALVLGTRDYATKNGFGDAVIAMSGGVDSTIVAVIAADALGAGRVHGVSMPSRYSSDGSRTDAQDLAEKLGIDFRTIPIEPAHAAFLEMLAPSFAGRAPDLTEENIQSRVRGMTLMGLSNKFGWLVLTTGNKSETAVGYTTLYGDTAGGFAVIKDVPKLLVYELCRWRNALAVSRGETPPINEDVLTKPPSAELRPDQRDDQSLPPYELLDPMLEAYVEHDRTAADLVAMGFDPALVERITGLVDRAEYKRRQSPPGVRVSPKAFGKDRRLPITNRYRG